jgi:hypothetical protein
MVMKLDEYNRPHYLCFLSWFMQKMSLHDHVCIVFQFNQPIAVCLVLLFSRDIIQWFNLTKIQYTRDRESTISA